MRCLTFALASLLASLAICDAAAAAVVAEEVPEFARFIPPISKSSDAPSHPLAQQLTTQALSAAEKKDWPSAIRFFTAAMELAHCAPSLYFNTALAYERNGQRAIATAWYRAYLAARPDASNAGQVQARIQAIADGLDDVAARTLDQAERAALALGATAPAGAKSARQSALEAVARYAYLGGYFERADALTTRIASLVGALPLGENLQEVRRVRGLLAAAWANDLREALAIETRRKDEIEPHVLAGYIVRIHAQRAQFAEVLAKTKPLTPLQLGQMPWLVDSTIPALLDFGGYDAADAALRPIFSIAKGFNEKLFYAGLRVAEEAFWGGRPDVARAVAADLKRHFEKNDVGDAMYEHAQYEKLILGLLGDRSALAATFREKGRSGSNYGALEMVLGRLALIQVLQENPPDFIMLTNRYLDGVPLLYEKRKDGLEGSQVDFPLVYFAQRYAMGDTDGAASGLNATFELLGKGYGNSGGQNLMPEYKHESYRRALRFGAAVGSPRLVLALAQHAPQSRHVVDALSRLKARGLLQGPDLAAADRYFDQACQGWRPSTVEQARLVAWTSRQAVRADPDDGVVLDDKIDTIAREAPETLPEELASRAVIARWMAMRARVRD